jgi:hypothetical protein
MFNLFLKHINLKNFMFIGLFYFALCPYQNCFARILDEESKLLGQVIDIFRSYKPLIEHHAEDIVQQKGLPKEKINHVLNSQTPISDISLEELNAIAQVVFLRPIDKERKDIRGENEQFLPYTDLTVLDLFSKIGDIDSIYPQKEAYPYILLNGSTVANMRERLKTLIELVEQKKLSIAPETKIIFLTGERDLFDEENEAQLMDPAPLKQDPSWNRPQALPVTEDQAAEWLWNQSMLPDALRQANITFVRAKKNPKTGARPTTFDTVHTWVEQHKPEPGACLSISSQPFVYYQQATTRGVFKKAGLLEKGFSVEGVGFGKDKNSEGFFEYFKAHIAVVLDNFARTIYTEVQHKKENAS